MYVIGMRDDKDISDFPIFYKLLNIISLPPMQRGNIKYIPMYLLYDGEKVACLNICNPIEKKKKKNSNGEILLQTYAIFVKYYIVYKRVIILC